MIRLNCFAVAFYGTSSHSQLVALIAQEEIIDSGGQGEPPGMHMIYLPYIITLQRHYAVLQALALEEDDLPEIKDETMPDEEGLARSGVVNAIEEFKLSVFGDKYDESDNAGHKKVSEASKKRKALADSAVQKSSQYNWDELARSGKLKDLTVVELKFYLTAHDLPVSGKKEDLVEDIDSHGDVNL